VIVRGAGLRRRVEEQYRGGRGEEVMEEYLITVCEPLITDNTETEVRRE